MRKGLMKTQKEYVIAFVKMTLIQSFIKEMGYSQLTGKIVVAIIYTVAALILITTYKVILA